MGKAIVIASGKGGTGKTMFAANLGVTLARQGHKTVLIDLDNGLRNLDLYLGMENNIVYDVNDVLTGVCRIRQAPHKGQSLYRSVIHGGFSSEIRRRDNPSPYQGTVRKAEKEI